MSDRQRELARERQRRLRARRRAEYAERLEVQAKHRRAELPAERPDLHRAIADPRFPRVWQMLYDEDPPADLEASDPDVLEYRLEAMWEDWQRAGLDDLENYLYNDL